MKLLECKSNFFASKKVGFFCDCSYFCILWLQTSHTAPKAKGPRNQNSESKYTESRCNYLYKSIITVNFRSSLPGKLLTPFSIREKQIHSLRVSRGWGGVWNSAETKAFQKKEMSSFFSNWGKMQALGFHVISLGQRGQNCFSEVLDIKSFHWNPWESSLLWEKGFMTHVEWQRLMAETTRKKA